jgi:hypothetical protein
VTDFNLNLPRFKQKDASARRLSMDEYLAFVEWGLSLIPDKKNLDRLARNARVHATFKIKEGIQ